DIVVIPPKAFDNFVHIWNRAAVGAGGFMLARCGSVEFVGWEAIDQKDAWAGTVEFLIDLFSFTQNFLRVGIKYEVFDPLKDGRAVSMGVVAPFNLHDQSLGRLANRCMLVRRNDLQPWKSKLKKVLVHDRAAPHQNFGWAEVLNQTVPNFEEWNEEA